jgi:enoyl-CoA hydratase/carnithine racemase
MPRNIALEMLLTGDPISATRGYELGFVNRLAEPGKSMEKALELAQQICVNAPLAVRLSLKIVKESFSLLDEKAQQERSNRGLAELAKTAFASIWYIQPDDYKEGPLAFIGKRPAKWTGKKAKM